jgi:DNA-nicking Smr family endonuclease
MNRDGGGKPGRHSTRAGRQITEEEAELWLQLGRSVDKVKTKPRVPAHDDGAAPSSPASEGPRQQPQRAAMPEPPAPPPPPVSPPSRSPAPAGLDRRTLRQVAGGKVPIDAVLDLHGLHQDAAHNRLRRFLMSCQTKGHRMVLIITGKGASGERAADRFNGGYNTGPAGATQRGVLRRSVPLWLDEPELRAIVVSYAAAGARHGGEGALYVRLRKAREA